MFCLSPLCYMNDCRNMILKTIIQNVYIQFLNCETGPRSCWVLKQSSRLSGKRDYTAAIRFYLILQSNSCY